MINVINNDAPVNDVELGFPCFYNDAQLIEQLSFIPGVKEFLTMRQVHALEHATVWMLSESGNSSFSGSSANHRSKGNTADNTIDDETIGGLSTDQGFFLHYDILHGEINPFKLRRAVNLALIRLQQGEDNLALHPRCGTNSSVAIALIITLVMIAHLGLPKEPIHQLVGMGLAALAANYLAPDLGIYVQKYITTAIPFNLELKKITKITDKAGNSGYFVKLNWINN